MTTSRHTATSRQDSIRVSIVGAGMAGLAAARALQDAGLAVTVWDKSRAPGGRVGTRHMSTHAAPIAFDSGAQNIKSSHSALDSVREQLSSEIEPSFIDAPVCLHENGQVLPGDANSNQERKWSCREGMAQLPLALARGLDLRLQTVVASLRQSEQIELLDADNQILDVADFVILTAPAPQSADLLQASSLPGLNEQAALARIALLRTVEYSRCLSVMLHFAASDEGIAWYALLARDRNHPLLWLARENAKGFVPQGEGTALIAQLGHDASVARWEADDARLTAETCTWIGEILGDGFRVPLNYVIKRWRYSQPRNSVDFDAVNPIGSRILIAGDGVAKGRVPDAYESGLRAAQRVLES